MNKQISSEVEVLRDEMERFALQFKCLSHPVVLEASERLDKMIYIVQYSRWEKWKK